MSETASVLEHVDPQSQSPFFNKLPTEVRLRIYGHALKSGTSISVARGTKDRFNDSVEPVYICKRIYEEATDVPFDMNTFDLGIPMAYPPQCPSKEAVYRKIRHLRVYVFADEVTRGNQETRARFAEQLSTLFELFESGVHLRSLDLKVCSLGDRAPVAVERVLIQFRGLEVNGHITITDWFTKPGKDYVPVSTEHKEKVVSAIREGRTC